ncbi:MAG TPA: hypothetical protein VKN16_21380 [Methylomirabilota bacterium]|jgi:hypothetical protein|nr:hypothetical protein [Methylomirabilota bacterium]
MSPSAEWGEFEWGEAEWGSVETGALVPATATLTLSGAAPSVLPVTRQPAAATLTLGGVAPVVTVTGGVAITPAAGQLSLTGVAPTVAPSSVRAVPAGALTLLGFAPTRTESFLFQLTWETDAALLSLLQLDWEVGAAEPIVGGTLPLEWSLDELLARLRLDWVVYQVGLEAAYEDDPQRPWARVTAS